MTLAADRLTLPKRLDSVSLEFEPGCITAICGPNGAGKSSLLQVLAGLLDPASGTVLLEGEPMAALSPRERAKRIGYLPQDPVVAWDVAVRSLIALGRLPHRDRGTQQVQAALDMLDLQRLADRPVSQLSGGERARVLLARVVAGEPQWLLADEPLAALDLRHRMEIVGHLKRLSAAGVGVVLVVHDLDLARNHADHAIVLDRGRLAASAAPDEALSSETINRVWQVSGEWHGPPGKQAFALAG